MPKAKGTSLSALTKFKKSSAKSALSPQDIEELLKDPNSWLSKLFATCQLIHAVTEKLFIDIILSAQQAIQREEKRLTEAMAEAREHGRIMWERLNMSIALTPQVSNDAINKTNEAYKLQLDIQLAVLVNTPQQKMTPVQLAAHHQMLIANYNQHIAAAIGPQIVLPNNIVLVAPKYIEPVAPVIDIVRHNPGLMQRIKAEPILQKDFGEQHAHAETGHLNYIHYLQAIFKENYDRLAQAKINVDSAILVQNTIKDLDAKAKGCMPKDLFTDLHKALAENNTLAIQQWFKVAPKKADINVAEKLGELSASIDESIEENSPRRKG